MTAARPLWRAAVSVLDAGGHMVADGAMGTELATRCGLAGPSCRLNLLRPEAVLALHREYLAAGARLLVANTLGATPDEALAGVRLARQAVSTAGEAAPQGRRDCPHLASPIAMGEAQMVFVAGSLLAEPAPEEALLDALRDADVLIVETVTSLGALEGAVTAVRRRSSQPLLATLSFGADGGLAGLSPREVARGVTALGFDAWGYGCGFGPEPARRVLTELRQAAPEAVLVAKPNVGLPQNGAYSISPVELAWARQIVDLGVQIIGACCGSTAAHIRAVAEALVDSKDTRPHGHRRT